MPPDPRDWLAEDDLVYFVMDLVSALDLEPIYRKYDGSRGGRPPFSPQMMTGLLFYAYCVGVYSSRKIEQATRDRISFRVLTGNQHPDHDTIADFRKRHLFELAGYFTEVLLLCQKAGLVKLGHISLDGTKMRANASKHKAMSYGRMEKKAEELRREVEELLEEARRTDEEEDDRHGKGRRGGELPDELKRREGRLEKIKEAMSALEEEAREKAEEKRQEQREKEAELQASGRKRRGRKPKAPSDKPESKSQRNFTDPESRIMKDGATKSFEQCYNCQAAVDQESQIVVAATVTQEPNDKQQVEPLIGELESNLGEENLPGKASADSGYFSEANVNYLQSKGIDPYIATGRQKHGEPAPAAPRGRIPANLSTRERMARKLRTKKGKAIYKERKQIVEPFFGQTKSARGFRQFLLRGLENVGAEWSLLAMTHNLLKLFRSGRAAAVLN